MNKSDNINEIATALSRAQRMITGAKKDSANPFFKSKYADLESCLDAIREPMASNGLSFSQLVQMDGLTPFLETMLMHTSGQYLVSRSPIICVKQNDPQSFGAALTYFRRFNLSSIIGLSAVDDDGNTAAGNIPSQNKKSELKFVDEPKKNETNIPSDDEINHALATASERSESFSRPEDFFSGPTNIASSNPPGDYVIPFGKKYKCKKIKDCNVEDLKSYALYLEESARSEGQTMSANAAEFVKKLREFAV